MSTATQTPTLPVTYENYNLGVIKKGTGKDTEYIAYPEDDAKKRAEAGEGELVGVQSFRMPRAGSLDGIKELVADEAEIVLLFNRGLGVKLQNKARSIIRTTEDDVDGVPQPTFTFSEEAFDMTEFAGEKTSRRGLSALEKVMEQLKNLSPEQRALVAQSLGISE